MPNLHACKIQFKFEFGSIDNRFIQVIVINGNQTNLVIPNDDHIGIAELSIELPTQLILTFTGKDPNTDTLVDKNGNITKDMYVKIISISLDGFELNNIFLHQKIKLLTETNQEITTSYVGFNGTVLIDMSESSVFSQYLSMNSVNAH
jgi:hypothetical protein